MDGVEEHEESRRESVLGRRREVAALLELVAQRQPLLLDQDPESVQGAVVGLQANLRQRRDLKS